jgi:hypothetical protein
MLSVDCSGESSSGKRHSTFNKTTLNTQVHPHF